MIRVNIHVNKVLFIVEKLCLLLSFVMLQEFIPPCGSNGGCPFKHFDDAALGQLLQSEDIMETTDILALRAENQFSCACSLYLKRKAIKPLKNQVNLQLPRFFL